MKSPEIDPNHLVTLGEVGTRPRCCQPAGSRQHCPPCPLPRPGHASATPRPSANPSHSLLYVQDGFYGDKANPANPGVVAVYPSDWASNEGQDFIADHSSPAIDFATFHGARPAVPRPSSSALHGWLGTCIPPTGRLPRPSKLHLSALPCWLVSHPPTHPPVRCSLDRQLERRERRLPEAVD